MNILLEDGLLGPGVLKEERRRRRRWRHNGMGSEGKRCDVMGYVKGLEKKIRRYAFLGLLFSFLCIYMYPPNLIPTPHPQVYICAYVCMYVVAWRGSSMYLG